MKRAAAFESNRMLSRAAAPITGIITLSWNWPPVLPAECDRLVVAQNRGARLHERFAEHGIHLPRHDGTTGLEVGEDQLVETAPGTARGEPANVVRDGEEGNGDGP